MPKIQKRDNAYYRERLKSEFPLIFADLNAGRYRTVEQAKIAAGMSTPRTRLHELKNAFRKASTAEQTAFLSWLGSKSIPVPPVPTPTVFHPIAINRQLVPSATKRINEIINKRGLKIGDVMLEIGYPKRNASIGRALHRRHRLQPGVISALETWISTNVAV
jgi:hypothetical protein